MEKCKAEIHHGNGEHTFSYRCSHKSWKDGYCKQHHPEQREMRKEKREAGWEDKKATGPYAKLRQANAEISRLQELIASLEAKLAAIKALGHAKSESKKRRKAAK